jgi:hypothetical protein
VNSVLQALYFCKPFREKIIQYKLQPKSSTNKNKDNLLNSLAELFYLIVTMKKKQGIVQPKKFIARLRKDNDAFDNLFQQDAHEFLNYLLNTCADILKAEMQEITETNGLFNRNKPHPHGQNSLPTNPNHFHTLPIPNHMNEKSTIHTSTTNSLTFNKHSSKAYAPIDDTLTIGPMTTNIVPKSIKKRNSFRSVSSGDTSMGSANSIMNMANGCATAKTTANPDDTWIHELFQGTLVNETKCLNCETVGR